MCFPTLYLGGLAWFLIALRVKGAEHVRGSTMLILMVLLCVKFTDIGAYFGGRSLGKHKLIFWLSPGKTWEGLFFGLLTAAAVGAVCSRFMVPRSGYDLPWWKGAIFGAVIGGIGQLGDLLESMMKRDADVKDSGSTIPDNANTPCGTSGRSTNSPAVPMRPDWRSRTAKRTR